MEGSERTNDVRDSSPLFSGAPFGSYVQISQRICRCQMHLGEARSKGRPLWHKWGKSWKSSSNNVLNNFMVPESYRHSWEDHLAEEAATLSTTAEPMIIYNLIHEIVDISWTIPWKDTEAGQLHSTIPHLPSQKKVKSSSDFCHVNFKKRTFVYYYNFANFSCPCC